MSSRRSFIAFFVLVFGFLHSGFSAPAPKPLYRDKIFDGAADPVVIHNRAEKNWLMFYTNRRANVPGLDGVSWVHGSPVGIAQSDDGGTTWKYRCDARFTGIPVPEGADAKTLTYWAPDVIESDGVYHMYLTLVPGVFTDWRHPRSILHLTSRNLIDWAYQSTLALSSDRVIDAAVHRLPDGTWRMWYNNERDRKSIYYADSPDLYKWTDKGKCAGVGERPGEGPYVFRWRGHYWMFVDLWKGLGVYRSDDLQNWTAQPGDPLLGKPGTGADDGVNGGHCGIVVDAASDRAYCFYFTHPGRNGTISPDDKNNLELRRSSIQVVELREENGVITCDRDKPTFINLAALTAAVLSPKNSGTAFTLFDANGAAPILYSAADASVVAIAARDLAADIERVSGKKPALIAQRDADAPPPRAVIAGTLGQNPLIDALAASGKLDVSKIQGQWETFVIATVGDALVIAGSDRRGTAYGVYELSQMIGVSPWHWWADVAPEKKTAFAIPAGARIYGPPSVKYRGIFINDEDWGLQPWAAKTFEPENKGIGPKTYGKVFELLLRLKANTLWPAMHKCSPAFNSNPANAALANDYAIVMGSSHAEPMLRNNVSEWTAPGKDYNYVTNRDGVLAYWEERAKTNGRYENIYTIGMRGIHDSGMQGGGSREEQIARLEKIFADQRALIAKHVSPNAERVPQMFCAYKEVLDLYRGGLRVPDDVTIMFPDDNFGYIRNFPSEADRAAMREGRRTGGFGIYYHVSYLGRPLAYLWLSTTPPALIWEEMHKAYELGADRIWIVNVGDIKPAEITTEFFLQMAWDINRWTPETLPKFLPEWAAREFGAAAAPAVARLMNEYFLFNYERRPEHLQWWLPGQKPRPSDLSSAARETRLERARAMQEQLATLRETISAEKQDAFYELVDYPVQGCTLANNRYFTGEEAALKYLAGDRAALDKLGYMGDVLNGQLARITHRYNNLTAGGKWRHFMQLEPADADWKSMRISPWRVPNFATPLPPETKEPLAVARFESVKNNSNLLAWEAVPGLGHGGKAFALFPSTTPVISPARATDDGPWLDFKYTLLDTAPATATARVRILPVHSIDGAGKLWLVCSFDEGKTLQLATLDINDGGPQWAQGVLANERVFKIQLPDSALSAGEHTLRLHGIDPSVVVDRVTIE